MDGSGRTPKIGDVFLMRFSGTGCEQNGWRPGLVFQNNTGNTFSPNIIALQLTSSIKKKRMPTHVFISSKQTELKMDSIVLCENPERMSKDRIGSYITTLSDYNMSLVAEASILASSVISFIDPEKLIDLWHKASFLNATAV